MDLEHISKYVQNCYNASPVLLLGSGASIPHGLGSMNDLSGHLQKSLSDLSVKEETNWKRVSTALKEGKGLENALLSSPLVETLENKIICHTWKFIAEADSALFLKF